MTGMKRTATRLTGALAGLVLAGGLMMPRAEAGGGGAVGVVYHTHAAAGAVHVGSYYYRPHHRHYGGGHHHYRHHHFGYHHHHHHGHGAGRTLLGIGIGLLAYDIIHKSKAHRRSPVAYPQEPYPADYPSRRSAARTAPAAPSENACLQIREYQTTITVGGEEREAYGDACLMPDGSWRLGPPKLVPAY